MKRLVCMVLAASLVGGCYQTSKTYEGREVGRTIETTHATVLASRIVDITAESANPVGPVAGGAAGGAGAGWATGSGWAAVLGAVAGAGAGYLAQQAVGNREGIEYIVHMDDGRTVTLVQNREGSEMPLPNGTHVLVQLGGNFTRVIQAPEGMERPASPPAGAAASSEGDGTARSAAALRAPPPPSSQYRAPIDATPNWGPPMVNMGGR